MEEIVAALAAEQMELGVILAALNDEGWHRPSRCEGWDVADVVLHLAQSDEMAIGSASGEFAEVLSRLTAGLPATTSVDEGAAAMVQREQGAPPAELLSRWSSGAARLVELLAAGDMSRRVVWVAGELSLRTLATTRLAETWIHSGDVASALGVDPPATDRLRPIARLAWRTLPYAFVSAGRTLSGPVAMHLSSPGGEVWEFLPEEPAVTTISGPAVELCAVAARRVDASSTSLRGKGPDAEAVLELIRTYA